MRFLILAVSLLLGSTSFAQKKFVTDQALAGDGPLAILARFRLEREPCNLEEFYKINKIKKNQPLKVGVFYKVPIQIYTYNRKSIMSTTGIKDEALAKRLDEYNYKMFMRGIKWESYKANLQLWVPHGMLSCPLPPMAAPAGRDYPFLGKDNRKIVLKDEKLAGAVYYLIPGHGGPDPGAVGKAGRHVLCEDEYAYDVTLRLAKNLLEHGAVVHLVVQDPNDGIRPLAYLLCDSDEVLLGGKDIPVNQKARLQQRTDLINELFDKHRKDGHTYQRVVEIHVDSRAKHERIDLFFYYFPGSAISKATAKAMFEVMQEKYKEHRKNGTYEGAVIPRELFTLANAKPPTVFIEMGNIQNQFDQKRLTVVSNRQAIADWLAEGLLLDF